MRITPLASGSQGNAVLIEAADARMLIDAGLEPDELEARVAEVGVRPSSIDVLLLTHRHKDHIRGAGEFARRHKTRCWAPRRTLRALPTQLHRRLRPLPLGQPRAAGSLVVQSFAVPHDAPDAVGYRVASPSGTYGHATDLGHADDAVRAGLWRCTALYLEFNHDIAMLEAGPYDEPLRRRVGGELGHLNNRQAAGLLHDVAWPGLQRVFLAHLSRNNNTRELAVEAARGALVGRADAELVVAEQDIVTAAVTLPAQAP